MIHDGDRFGPVMAFEFVIANQATYRIARMCQVLEVSTSRPYVLPPATGRPRRAPGRTRNSTRGCEPFMSTRAGAPGLR